MLEANPGRKSISRLDNGAIDQLTPVLAWWYHVGITPCQGHDPDAGLCRKEEGIRQEEGDQPENSPHRIKKTSILLTINFWNSQGRLTIAYQTLADLIDRMID